MITESEAMEQFDQMLDECYPVVHVAGYDYDVSRALKMLDPVAYRQEFLNFCDAGGIDLD